MKNKTKNLECHLLQISLGALRVNCLVPNFKKVFSHEFERLVSQTVLTSKFKTTLFLTSFGNTFSCGKIFIKASVYNKL